MVSVTRAFRDPALRIPAIRAMRHLDQPLLAASLLSNWPYYSPDECRAVVETLVSRKPWALLLLDAVAAGEIPKSDLSAAQARSLADSGDASLRASVLDHWGDPHRSDDQKQATLDRATRLLTSAPEGDPVKGRETFTRACGICHTLFGEGGKLGPDLTGRNRADLTPLLTSIIDPSAEVPEDGRLTVVTRKDGGILSGILISSNASNLVIRTQQGDISVKAADIASSASPTTSPMPEGLLEPLSDTQLIDLLSYIRSDQK